MLSADEVIYAGVLSSSYVADSESDTSYNSYAYNVPFSKFDYSYPVFMTAGNSDDTFFAKEGMDSTLYFMPFSNLFYICYFPVINVKADIEVTNADTADGTKNKPYIIE